MRTRFYEVVALLESLNEEARDRLLKRWEGEVTKNGTKFNWRVGGGVDEPGGSGDRFLIGRIGGIYSG
jgi:hypothetical protein